MRELLAPLVLFAIAVTLTPGPNVVLVTASAANFGFRRTIPQMLGITLAFGLMTVMAGLGLASVVHAEPRLHALLKFAGAAYLLYLAWRIARTETVGANPKRGRPIHFLEAALFTWLNPKAWVSTLGAVAAFTSQDGDMVWESSTIALVLAIACLLSCVIWAGCGVAISRFLARPGARRSFNYTMAGLLVLSLIPVFS